MAPRALAAVPKLRSPKPTPVQTPTVVIERKPGETEPQTLARVAVDGIEPGAQMAWSFLRNGLIPQLDLSECAVALRTAAEAVHRNDLRWAEGLLVSQSTVLNALFLEMLRVAELNRGQYPEATDRYMRLALTAQRQCRATLETLALVKNPTTVIARQANIASGPQQVNNTALVGDSRAGAGTNPGTTQLLEAVVDGERVDAGTASAAGARDSSVATVDALDRTAHAGGQGAVRDEWVSGRTTTREESASGARHSSGPRAAQRRARRSGR